MNDLEVIGGPLNGARMPFGWDGKARAPERVPVFYVGDCRALEAIPPPFTQHRYYRALFVDSLAWVYLGPEPRPNRRQWTRG